jgi:hypothetical protein
MKACPTFIGWLGEPWIAAQVFGDGDRAGKICPDVAVDPLHQAPAIRELIGFIAVNTADIKRTVVTQTVDVILLQPHARVVADKLPHFSAPVVWTSTAPGSFRPVVVIEINAALVVFLPSVKLPEVQVARSEVVIHNIHHDPNATLVRFTNEHLETIRTPINALHCKDMRRVVAPRVIACKLRNRHDLDDIHAQPFDMVQFLQSILETTRFSLCVGKKGTDMHFVNDQLVMRR